MARVEHLVHNVRLKTRRALEEVGFGDNKTLVVAVSGGPDSLTLFDSLVSISSRANLRLHAAHLNHGIRFESTVIAEQMAEFFIHSRVPFTIERADVPKFQQQTGLSLEAAARRIRYGFLAGVADKQAADAIVTAHSAGDQAETVLLHLLRGSGVAGLSGMRFIQRGRIARDLPETTLLRPLLNVTREEIESYCRYQGLTPEYDATNLSLDYTRNRIRHQLLPELAKFNPSIEKALSRLSVVATEMLEFVDLAVDQVWDDIVQVGEFTKIDREAFSKLHAAIKKQLIRRYIKQVVGDLEDISFVHVNQLVGLMEGPAGKEAQLPRELRFVVDKLNGFFLN